MKLTTLINSLNDFFFKPQPVHSVALIRIFFGAVLIINWFMVWSHLEVFWGVDGILSLDSAIKYSHAYRFNLFQWLPNDPRVPTLLALVSLVGAFGVTFGFFTRTSILISLATLLSFHNRNVFLLNSSDIVIRNFLFLLFFTPSGDLFSVDRWIKVKRGVAPEVPLEKSPWALRLMQIQFSIIYIATTMFKVKGPLWADGTAVYTATRLDEFVRVPLAILNNIWIIKFLTWSTLVVEFALGTLVWIKELRYWILLAGIGLHMGIEITMNIPMFEWVMVFAMVCMIDSRDIQHWLQLAKEGKLFSKISMPPLFVKVAKAE